jgi:hypothetical protein
MQLLGILHRYLENITIYQQTRIHSPCSNDTEGKPIGSRKRICERVDGKVVSPSEVQKRILPRVFLILNKHSQTFQKKNIMLEAVAMCYFP